MRTRYIAAAAVAGIALSTAGTAAAHSPSASFEPLPGSAYGQLSDSWTNPWLLPAGYSQEKVADETDLDIYADGVDDLTDMSVTNETGRDAGRYLYRTHEVGSNGAVSVVDLKTGEAKVLTQREDWRRLDGIDWTPWGTLLFAEEAGPTGRLFEAFFDKKDPTKVVRVEERTQLGRISHEGIAIDRKGNVYVINELNGGSIFRFVPTKRGDLSQGQLYALKITGLTDAQQVYSSTTITEKVGAYEWVALDMSVVQVDAQAAANAVAATQFGRPEDAEVIDDTLYIANTSEDRVVAIELKGRTPQLTNFVLAGQNVPVEDGANAVTGFNNPDNLAKTNDGRLIVVEDNVPSDIWFTTPDRDCDGVADSVSLFASLTDSGAEGTGIYVNPREPRSLYVNIQHPDKPLADGTWKITKDRSGRGNDHI